MGKGQAVVFISVKNYLQQSNLTLCPRWLTTNVHLQKRYDHHVVDLFVHKHIIGLEGLSS